MSIRKVMKAIDKYDNMLVISHVNPEADAIGSQLAFSELVRMLGKKDICLNSDRVPRHYSFLPGVKRIKHTLNKGSKFQAIFVLDCPTAERTGRFKKIFKDAHFIIFYKFHIFKLEIQCG